MKFLRKLISFITVGAITTTVGTWILDTTLLRSEFIIDQVRPSGFYEQFTKDFPKFLRQSPDANTQANSDVIGAIITPAYVQGKFESYFVQLENRYRHDGPKPTLDLTDLNQIAERNGFKLKDAPQKPLELGDPLDPKIASGFFANMNKVKIGGLIISLILLAVTWLAGAAHARFKSLGKTFIWSGVGLLPNVAVFKFIPGAVAATIQRDPKTQALGPAVKPLLDSLFGAVANRFLVAAGVLAALGAICFGVYMFLEKRGAGKPKPPKAKKPRDEGGLVPQP